MSQPGKTNKHLSTFDFGQKRPTEADWAAWAEFWGRFTLHGLYLVSLLGDWVASTHRLWEWHNLPDTNTIEQTLDGGIEYYMASREDRTRGDRKFTKGSAHRDRQQPQGYPCLVVSGDTATSMVLHGHGPALKEKIDKPD